MQAKDIDDVAVLRAIEICCELRGYGAPSYRTATRWDIGTVLAVAYGALPEKLVTAKLRKLRRRDFIDGCDCGCRGEWHLVDMHPPQKWINAMLIPRVKLPEAFGFLENFDRFDLAPIVRPRFDDEA